MFKSNNKLRFYHKTRWVVPSRCTTVEEIIHDWNKRRQRQQVHKELEVRNCTVSEVTEIKMIIDKLIINKTNQNRKLKRIQTLYLAGYNYGYRGKNIAMKTFHARNAVLLTTHSHTVEWLLTICFARSLCELDYCSNIFEQLAASFLSSVFFIKVLLYVQ